MSMTVTTAGHGRSFAARLHQTWAEMDHAQRRLLEIRTGQPFVHPPRNPGIASSVAELEALYSLEDPGQPPG